LAGRVVDPGSFISEFPFWMVISGWVWLFCPLPLFTIVAAGVVILSIAIFFLGPALAIQAAERPLFEVIARSVGTVPAFALRVCCLVFLVQWLAPQAGVSVWSSSVVLRHVSEKELLAYVVVLLVFLFFTGLQSRRTEAALGKFSTKLGYAVLLAAFIRVRDGWPALIQEPALADNLSWDTRASHGLLGLVSYLAPLASSRLTSQMEASENKW